MKKFFTKRSSVLMLSSALMFANVSLASEITGTASSTNATTLGTSLDNVTLKLTNALSWNGQAQRYGNYTFTVDSDATLTFHAGATGSSWVGLYQNGALVADKWTAADTDGVINVPAGTYTMFVNKNGDDVGTVGLRIITNGSGNTDNPDNTDNPPLTRAELVALIKAYTTNPTAQNADKVIHANTSEITDMSALFSNNDTFNLDISG